MSFCGKGQITNEGNNAIKSGCFFQPNHDEGIDVEACFCDSGKKITHITIKKIHNTLQSKNNFRRLD